MFKNRTTHRRRDSTLVVRPPQPMPRIRWYT